MARCENCSNEIRENRSHEKSQEGYECLIRETDSQRPVGFSRRRPGKDLYKKR
jgi:hypothetical protein